MPDSSISSNFNINLAFWAGPSLLILGIGLWHAYSSISSKFIRILAFWTGPSLMILGIGLWHAGQSHHNQLSVSIKKIRKTFVSEVCLENKYFFPLLSEWEGGGGGSGGLGHLAFTTAGERSYKTLVQTLRLSHVQTCIDSIVHTHRD